MKRDEEKRLYQKRQGEKATCHLSTITQSQRTVMIIHIIHTSNRSLTLCACCVCCVLCSIISISGTCPYLMLCAIIMSANHNLMFSNRCLMFSDTVIFIAQVNSDLVKMAAGYFKED